MPCDAVSLPRNVPLPTGKSPMFQSNAPRSAAIASANVLFPTAAGAAIRITFAVSTAPRWIVKVGSTKPEGRAVGSDIPAGSTEIGGVRTHGRASASSRKVSMKPHATRTLAVLTGRTPRAPSDRDPDPSQGGLYPHAARPPVHVTPPKAGISLHVAPIASGSTIVPRHDLAGPRGDNFATACAAPDGVASWIGCGGSYPEGVLSVCTEVRRAPRFRDRPPNQSCGTRRPPSLLGLVGGPLRADLCR
jgi:hypothetical protein